MRLSDFLETGLISGTEESTLHSSEILCWCETCTCHAKYFSKTYLCSGPELWWPWRHGNAVISVQLLLLLLMMMTVHDLFYKPLLTSVETDTDKLAISVCRWNVYNVSTIIFYRVTVDIFVRDLWRRESSCM